MTSADDVKMVTSVVVEGFLCVLQSFSPLSAVVYTVVPLLVEVLSVVRPGRYPHPTRHTHVTVIRLSC